MKLAIFTAIILFNVNTLSAAVTSVLYNGVAIADGGPSESPYTVAVSAGGTPYWEPININARSENYYYDGYLMWAAASASGKYFEEIGTGKIGPFTLNHQAEVLNAIPYPLEFNLDTRAESVVFLKFSVSEESRIDFTALGIPLSGYGLSIGDSRRSYFNYSSSTTTPSLDGMNVVLGSGSYELTSVLSVQISPGSGPRYLTQSPSLRIAVTPTAIPEPHVSSLLVLCMLGYSVTARRRSQHIRSARCVSEVQTTTDVTDI
jgi:hypothetical protein